MKQLWLVLALLLLVVAGLYWTGHFYPSGVHAKHGVVAAILALFCLVGYRFQTASPAK
jgi:hypothetical protein